MNIGEFSKIVGIPQSTIRFYESQGIVQKANKVNGIRVYEKDDIQCYKFITILKEAGMSNVDIKEYLMIKKDFKKEESIQFLNNQLDVLKEREKQLKKAIKVTELIKSDVENDVFCGTFKIQ